MNEHDKGQIAASAAEVYEQFFVPALFAEWSARVLEAAGVQPGDRVLDVACGTGILARKAAELVGKNGAVTGVDINNGMLAVARKKGPGVTWKVGPAESLPFEANSFDRVVSQFGLMFFEDQVQALREMDRVVRPGGTIAVAVWDSLEATPGYAVVTEVLNELFGPEAAKSIEVPYSLGDKEELMALFTEAGMGDAAVHTMMGQVQFPSVEDWIYVDIKGWTLADVVDDDRFERLNQYAPTKLNRFVQADGSVAFDGPAHVVVVGK